MIERVWKQSILKVLKNQKVLTGWNSWVLFLSEKARIGKSKSKIKIF